MSIMITMKKNIFLNNLWHYHPLDKTSEVHGVVIINQSIPLLITSLSIALKTASSQHFWKTSSSFSRKASVSFSRSGASSELTKPEMLKGERERAIVTEAQLDES